MIKKLFDMFDLLPLVHPDAGLYCYSLIVTDSCKTSRAVIIPIIIHKRLRHLSDIE